MTTIESLARLTMVANAVSQTHTDQVSALLVVVLTPASGLDAKLALTALANAIDAAVVANTAFATSVRSLLATL